MLFCVVKGLCIILTFCTIIKLYVLILSHSNYAALNTMLVCSIWLINTFRMVKHINEDIVLIIAQ